MADEYLNSSNDDVGDIADTSSLDVSTDNIGNDALSQADNEVSTQTDGLDAPDSGDAFLDELDQIDTPADTRSTASTNGKTPSLVRPKGDAATDTQLSTDASRDAGKQSDPDTAQSDASGTDEHTEISDDTDADWSKINAETEAYIKKLPSTGERQRARAAERASNMQRSFLNPACPAEQFVANLEKKSGMRYSEVESAILRRNAETDPLGLLSKTFEATADANGNSDAYQRLLDSMVDSNTEYVLGFLKNRGYDLSVDAAGNTGARAHSTQITDQQIDAFEQTDAFEQFADTFPEEADVLHSILQEAKHAKAAAAQAAQNGGTSEQRKQQEQQAKQEAVFISNFNDVYGSEVADHVESLLDKDYGLAVAADEQEKNPMMAFLKNAKRAFIKAGGLDGSGDLDNDLYEYGRTRPAFAKAAKAMIAYAQAGEKDNLTTAAKELKQFVPLFLAERLKLPEVKLIDEVIQIVAKHQKAGFDAKRDTLPDSGLSRAATVGYGSGDSLLDDIDRM